MKEKILLGGYTKRVSKGVYSVILDTKSAQLSDLNEVATVQNPTYITIDEHNHLYTCAADGNGGGVAAFDFDGKTAKHINNVTSTGAPLCYVAVDEARQLVYGANYHLGEIRVYKIQLDGSLKLTDTVKHEGSGPRPEQNAAHVHYADLTPDGRLVTCDLGTDEVTVYDVIGEGKLNIVTIYRAEKGMGARHLTFHPNGKIAYLAGELNSTVEVLSYNEEKGRFARVQTITTLPESHEGFNGVAAIRISSDGKFLYVSNRGNDSLAIYQVSPLGTKLEIIGWVPTEGNIPRDFNFNKTEDFIIVAHQNSDNLTLFARDKSTGKLTLEQKDFYAPEATCVLPL
ncbi:MAG: lactonase family protein [Streptococcaceae bacterium]|nr:lactonase family protein [Streptococcaceae bacterium]